MGRPRARERRARRLRAGERRGSQACGRRTRKDSRGRGFQRTGEGIVRRSVGWAERRLAGMVQGRPDGRRLHARRVRSENDRRHQRASAIGLRLAHHSTRRAPSVAHEIVRGSARRDSLDVEEIVHRSTARRSRERNPRRSGDGNQRRGGETARGPSHSAAFGHSPGDEHIRTICAIQLRRQAAPQPTSQRAIARCLPTSSGAN